ncbi:hypothetical protein CVT24_011912 [Panaeolus cyanescens]|uniref:F-box domain-containing protein n=1 Tax=Panaeolus cyanescens TaxID=181874 RepID=A0A409WDW5_9AGAR|nr:hypothetical protein CVT24_011912 [Panaeolus cyanescens]
MATESTPVFPVEISGLIIDKLVLRSDFLLGCLEPPSRKALRACSLTCKYFERLARPHLFHTTYIELAKYDDIPPHAGSVKAWMELLDRDKNASHGRQRLSQHIKSLHVSFGYYYREVSILPLPTSSSGYTFAQIFSELDRLDSLALFGLFAAPADLEIEATLLQREMVRLIGTSKSLRSITTCSEKEFFLEIANSMHSFGHITHLHLPHRLRKPLELSQLCWFPNLQGLDVEQYTRFVDDDIPITSTTPLKHPSFSLKMLKLSPQDAYTRRENPDIIGLTPLLDFFRRHSQIANCDPFSNLELLDVYISVGSDRDTLALASVLESMPRLKSFALSAYNRDTPYHQLGQLQIGQRSRDTWHHLTRLSLYFNGSYDTVADDIMEIFNEISAFNRLESVHLDFCSDQVTYDAEKDEYQSLCYLWEWLGQRFGNPQAYPKLRSVIIEFEAVLKGLRHLTFYERLKAGGQIKADIRRALATPFMSLGHGRTFRLLD